jgi:membrane protein
MLFYATVTLGPVILAWGFLQTHRLQAAVDVSSLDRLLPVGLSTIAFVLALRSLPDTAVRWGPALTGGLVTAVLFEVAKVGFGQYTTVLGAADTAAKIYGSLGLFPVFLLWLYVLWTIVLLGVEIAYVVQRREDLGNAEERRLAGTRRGMPDAFFALQVVMVVGRRYLGGGGPSPEPVVTHALGCEPPVCQEALDYLEEAGVLARTAEGLLPALPLDVVTGGEVLRRYRARTRPPTAPTAPGSAVVDHGFDAELLGRPIAELLG